MGLIGRQKTPDGYRFGFGGHEKDDEVKGDGNHLSFGDYGYDPRLGRRWNLDPIDQVSISNYATFSNSPIIRVDPTGLTDFEINGETKTIDDGKDNIIIKANERQYNKAKKRFEDGERSYEKYLNKLFKKNEYTSFQFRYAADEQNGIIGTEVTITKHNSKGSSIDWDKAVQNADEFLMVAAMADGPLPIGDAVGVIWNGTTRLGKLLFGGAKVSRIQAGSLKEFKLLVQQLSKPGSQLSKSELQQFEKLTEQFGGKLRYDLNPIKGKKLQPHVQVEGLGSKVGNRHIWLE